jgi:hypothetical protein
VSERERRLEELRRRLEEIERELDWLERLLWPEPIRLGSGSRERGQVQRS